MWEVVAKNKATGFERRVVARTWARTQDVVQKSLDEGLKVTVKQYFSDVLVADPCTGDFIVVAKRISPRRAAMLSEEYAAIDREAGCVLWPHGSPLPKGWSIVA